MELEAIRTGMRTAAERRRNALHSLDEASREARRCDIILSRTEEARGILQAVAQSVQQTVHDKVAGVVSTCLSAVFDEPYEFHINFVQKRGRTEAELVFVRDGVEVDPMTASGGGVVDVVSFALRLACLMLTRPAPRKLIVLDEPFKFVSAEYRDRIREMLLGLAGQMGVQFIMVTHVRELECGKVIRMEGSGS
jgi:DNA repair exonuclease SbcCD ATPase subunit